MDIGSAGMYIFLLIMFYILAIRPFLLARRKFKCKRCGNCCKFKVELTIEDIKRITKAGKRDFIVNKKYLQRENGYCKFLKFENSKAKCIIQDIKPEICASWPISEGMLGKLADYRCKSYWGKWF